MTSNFFSPLSFVAVFGSGIRDPGSGMGKNQDPGSGINIPDPQHCYRDILSLLYLDGYVYEMHVWLFYIVKIYVNLLYIAQRHEL
jgi:hypothetical protein